MKSKHLTTRKDIYDFLEQKNRFDAHKFISTDYNSFITMKGIVGWENRPFHMYRVETGVVEDTVVDGKIQIVSVVGLPEKDNLIKAIKPYSDRFVYEIKVSQISEVGLREILK